MENLFLTESKELQDYKTNVFAFLQREGYTPRLGDVNNIEFTYCGHKTTILMEDTNLGVFVRIVQGFSFLDVPPRQFDMMLSNANKINGERRGIKAYYKDRFIVIDASFWSKYSSDFEELFKILIASMHQSYIYIVSVPQI